MDIVKVYRGTDFELCPFETFCADFLKIEEHEDAFTVVEHQPTEECLTIRNRVRGQRADPPYPVPIRKNLRTFSKNMFGYTKEWFKDEDDE